MLPDPLRFYSIRSILLVFFFFAKGSTVAQWLALLPRSTRDLGSIPGWITVCVKFTRSPRVCVGFLRVLRFPPIVQKDVQVRWIGHAKFFLCVPEQAPECGN